MLEAGFLCFQRLLFDDSELLSFTMAGCLLGNMYMKHTEKTVCLELSCARYPAAGDVPREKSICILKCCDKNKGFQWAPYWEGVSQKTFTTTEATEICGCHSKRNYCLFSNPHLGIPRDPEGLQGRHMSLTPIKVIKRHHSSFNGKPQIF